MKPDTVVVVSLIAIYFAYKLYIWLPKDTNKIYTAKPSIKIPSLKLSDIIKNNHCYQIQIPGFPHPQIKTEILMKCVNEQIRMTNETYFWRQEKIEIVCPFFSKIEAHFPEISNGKSIADYELKKILPFIIENGYLEKVEPALNKGFTYRYTQLSQDLIHSGQFGPDEFKKTMNLVDNYSEIYTDLIRLEHKWQIKKFMDKVISYNWLPKKYWY